MRLLSSQSERLTLVEILAPGTLIGPDLAFFLTLGKFGNHLPFEGIKRCPRQGRDLRIGMTSLDRDVREQTAGKPAFLGTLVQIIGHAYQAIKDHGHDPDD